MPELPEVETVRRSLTPHLVGQTIATATARRADVVSGDRSPAALLQGETVDRLDRRGKQLAVVARTGRVLLIQLGMSGQVLVAPSNKPLPTHVHALWTIKGRKSSVLFRDPRRFGGLTTLSTVEDLHRAWDALGPDALSATGTDLWNGVHASNRSIKAALLDQRVVAGVGNIYADESLFEAGIHPAANCRRLSRPRIARLAAAVVAVLARAVKARGSTLRDYRDADGESGGFAISHRVYGRAGRPCTRCGKTLKKTAVAQRTTVYCPACQKR